MESCQSGRSCGTRNAVSLAGPRVRIPDSPPSKNPVTIQVYRIFSCIKKMADNAAIPLYQKYYKRYAARVRFRQIKEPDFKKWKYQAMTKRDECTDGKITLSEFEEWLEASFPNHKKRD